VLPYLLAVDLVIGVGLTVASLAYLEIRDLAGAVGMCASVYLVHVAVWVLDLRVAWAPIVEWERRGRAATDAELLAADRAVEQLPRRLTWIYALSWGLYWAGIAAFAWFVAPDVVLLGRHELVAVFFEVVASLIGASVLIFPLVRLLLHDTKVELGAELGERKIEVAREHTPLAPRFVVLALGMALAPVTWQFGTTWLAHADAARERTRLELRRAIEASARALDEGRAPADAAHVVLEDEDLPAPLREAQVREADDAVAIVDLRTEHASAAARTADGRWVVADAPVVVESTGFWVGTLGLVAALVGWVLVTAGGSVRLLARPLGRLDDAVRRIVEVGDLGDLDRIPVAYEDEISGLTRQFNAMLDQFDELARAARSIASGDLRVRISGPGELHAAFSAMVERLGELVGEVRTAASELASAAAEIHATAHGQEQAMTHQAEGVGKASEAMRRLAESATAITSAAGEVLDNAEQARGHSDEVGARIAELSESLGRIGELLELIREIADRSDLLALNGSLEATRAGETGRGFALVATEMRRLAERVTQTVADVRLTITNIEAASAASVAATAAGRQLTGNTADAARFIVDVTGSQSEETKLVSTSVRELATAVSQSVTTAEQTRAAADGLREQAVALEHLTRDFRILADEPAAGKEAESEPR
jgi:methyl-accepting chemotaxis protein